MRHDVSFTSDGESCAAWLYLPDSTRPAPVIVMAHGLGAVRSMRLDAFAERFCDAGYACLVFDYRHFGDSGGEPRQLLDVDRQRRDWAAALAHARTRADVDTERVVLWGTSFSDGHVIATAARDHAIAAVIAQCPFTDGLASLRALEPRNAVALTAAGLRDVARALRGRPPHLVPLAGRPGEVALMNAPDVVPGYLGLVPPDSSFVNAAAARIALRIAAVRPGRAAKRITCPAFFALCDDDSVAPADVSARHLAGAPRAEVRHYATGHFDIYTGSWFETVVADELAFLRRHVPLDARV